MDNPAVTIEDSAVAKEAEVKEEGKGDASVTIEEKLPTESESVTTKDDENVQPPLVVNGTSDAVKENSSATLNSPKSTEPVVVDSNKVVAEPAISGTEEAPKTEKATESVEASKQNGPEAPTTEKIEVKDDVKTDVEIITSSNDSNALNQPDTQKSSEIKSGGNSEVQNLPPPPLPSTPAPSQVMVFALSDSKSHDQEQQIPLTVVETKCSPDENLPIALPIDEKPIEPVVVSTDSEAPAPEKPGEMAVSEKVSDSNISSEHNETSISEVKTEQTLSLLTSVLEVGKKSVELPAESPSQVSTEPNLEKTEEKKIDESENMKVKVIETSSEDQAQNVSTKTEIISEAENIITKILTNKDKSDIEINPEQIAETIALIDEVTKEAAEITQQKLESQQSGLVEISTKCTESETSCNSPIPADSVPKAPETTSSTDNQIPPEKSSPVKESVVTEAKLSDEYQNIAISSSSPETINTIADISKTESAGNGKVKEILSTETITEVQPKTEGEAASCCDDSTKVSESPVAAADTSPIIKSKENGVEDTHEPPAAETSATESLSEHNKTVEEIKLEQQAEKKPAEVTAETAAATVAE